LTYTIALQNSGLDDDPMVWLTDTLPISGTYVDGSLIYPSGVGDYDPSTGVITWTGVVTASESLEINFAIVSDVDLQDGDQIINSAHIWDGVGGLYKRTVTSTVSLPPTIIETLPADGDVSISIDAPIVVAFSKPMDSQSLQVSLIPNPGGQGVEWNNRQTVFTLTHAALNYSQAYTVSVEADDQSGMPLQSGEIPNPWSFTTEIGPAPYILATSPAAGQEGVAITETLTISFSEPVITGTLLLTVTPISGNLLIEWNDDTTVLTATTEIPWDIGQLYTITVAVTDEDGLGLVPGPVSNPWSFRTIYQDFLEFFIPIVVK
jgi:hypothetical protein